MIASILIQDGYAVQSFGYNVLKPLGNPLALVENLARWNVDEISITDIGVTKKNYSINYPLIHKISKYTHGTPLIYGGGIRSTEDAAKVIEAGADRIIVENSVLSNDLEFSELKEEIGAQAIMMSLPLIERSKNIYVYNYTDGRMSKLRNYIDFFNNINISELILIDVINEGSYKTDFNISLIENDYFKNKSIICKGGIRDTNVCIDILQRDNVSAVMLGNVLNLAELNYLKFKKAIISNNANLLRNYHEV